jgi:hypothetical protein
MRGRVHLRAQVPPALAKQIRFKRAHGPRRRQGRYAARPAAAAILRPAARHQPGLDHLAHVQPALGGSAATTIAVASKDVALSVSAVCSMGSSRVQTHVRAAGLSTIGLSTMHNCCP